MRALIPRIVLGVCLLILIVGSIAKAVPPSGRSPGSAKQSATSHDRPVTLAQADDATQDANQSDAQPPEQSDRVKQDAATDVAPLSYVPVDAVAALVAHPRRVLTGPQATLWPTEVITAAGLQEWGLDAMQIDAVLVLVAAPIPMKGPGAGAVLHFAQPYDPDAAFAKLIAQTEPASVGRHTYQRTKRPDLPSIFLANQRTILLGTDEFLRKMIVAKEVDSPLVRRLKKADLSADAVVVVSVDAIRDLAKAALKQVPALPSLAQLTAALDETSNVEVHAGLAGQLKIMLIALNEESCAKLERAVKDTFVQLQQLIQANMAAELAKSRPDPVALASQHYVQRLVADFFDRIKTEREGDRVTISMEATSMEMAQTGVLMALLLPAVQAAREASRRSISLSEMKQIGIAMLTYENAEDSFPSRASFTADGKPLLSWRVQLLPYFGQNELYKQFHLDEPWDSENNKKLIPRMPDIYRSPTFPDPGRTVYLLPIGPGTMFEGKDPVKSAQVSDGLSRTIMVVEADPDRAVIWTKPEDLEYKPTEPRAGLGGLHPPVFFVLLGDGSVRAISNDVDPTVLRAMFTSHGGDAVNLPVQ